MFFVFSSIWMEGWSLGSLTWPGCFESVTWIIFNEYQQVLNTYLQTLFPHILRFSNNRQVFNVDSSAQRNVRTNIGVEQWFRSTPTKCYPINNLLQYHGKHNRSFSSNPLFECTRILVNQNFDLVRS